MTRIAALARAAVVAALGGAIAIGAAIAATPPEWPDALGGRVRHIKETRVVQVGYRANAIPFSYVGPGGRPIGYSLDLCAAIVATLADELGGTPLAIEYVPVTAQDRIARVRSGAVDLECGATTNTSERRRQVAFSPVIFVTGTRIAVARGSAVRGFADLAHRKVVVVAGTTNETAMREIDRLHGLGAEFIAVDDYREALARLAAGDAAALAADDVLLRGLLVATGRGAEFRLVGDMLSFEPYGIMYPRDDPALAAVVERALGRLAASREIAWIYNRWFTEPLPESGRLDLPMSVQLVRSLELIGLPPD